MQNSTNNNVVNPRRFFAPPPKILITDNQWEYLQGHHRLTYRELQIAKLVCKGLTNKDISGTLSITNGTVKTHIRNIYRKTRAHSRISMLLQFVKEIDKPL